MTVNNITQLLIEWRSGNNEALDRLMPLVYAELRIIANKYLAREKKNHTLEPTALVHEAFLKIVNWKHISWQNRAHFFGISAQLMRNILVDHARARLTAKRGGEKQIISLENIKDIAEKKEFNLLSIDQALSKLEDIDPIQSKIVELKFFAGLTNEEAAEVMEMSTAMLRREWALAKAWLLHELSNN